MPSQFFLTKSHVIAQPFLSIIIGHTDVRVSKKADGDSVWCGRYSVTLRTAVRGLMLFILVILLLGNTSEAAAVLSREEIAELVMPPYQLGEPAGLDGVWTIETSGGELAGYVFESKPLAPIPGFSGDPINLLITIDRDGRFLDVTILEQNEPIFVSGLGPGPFHDFVQQYRGLSIGDSITVNTDRRPAQDTGSTHAYVDGITKATASVRIANETILAAAIQVARERMQGVARRATARPLPDYQEPLDWSALVSEGIARPLRLTNGELQAAFEGSLWQDDDPYAKADPEGTYLDLWVIDIGPPSVARAVLSEESVAAVDRTVNPHEEAILVLANGRHRLVDEDFVRNSEPDRIAATQDGLPVTLRDADINATLAAGVPPFEQAMVLRADTRLGFDPASPWTLVIRAIREHGTFRPEPGVRDYEVDYQAPARFFDIPTPVKNTPPWLAAIHDRAFDIVLLIALLVPLIGLLAVRMTQLARHPRYPRFRLGMLAFMVVFVGWWAQGQLSIVTPLGIVRGIVDGRSLAFLLYEPFLLIVWGVTLISLVVWGRGFFCGWLCPYGALQEFAYVLGRKLKLPKLRVHPADDHNLKRVKFLLLAILIVATFTSATAFDFLVELEPFKTAITLLFDRSLPFVIYAVFWLVLGLFMFKGFCRYLCPLGAALALAGKFRRLDWIRRRTECGSPCQYCKARCAYGAIEADGRINYDECFQCLDCVTIIESPKLCIPDRLAEKRRQRAMPAYR
jgi:transcriptional regulator of nitric oxide reductase/ferredoxin